MNFMQKTGKFPIDADKKCEEHGLYVEQAYIMLEKREFEQAQQILLKRIDSSNIQQCIILAIRFEFIDTLISKLISRANHNTGDVMILLEYIDQFTNPENLIDQFSPDVEIGEIRENLQKAFYKLDLYINLIQAAVRVSGVQCHNLFLRKKHI